MISKKHIVENGIVIIPCDEFLTCPDFAKAKSSEEQIEHAIISACGDCGYCSAVQLSKIIKREDC